MSASMNRRNEQAQSLLAIFVVRTPEPIYVRPLRAPLASKPMTMAEAKRVFEESGK